jgi:hypothetical protein
VSWHNPTDPKEHINKARGHALLTSHAWRCSWTNTVGKDIQQSASHPEGLSLISSLIEHCSGLQTSDFPKNSSLYLATANFVLAPKRYAEKPATLTHKLLDETIPELAIRSWALAWPKDSYILAEVIPSFFRVWRHVTKNGEVIPLVERDLRWLHTNADHDDLVCVHILPGFFQVSIKKNQQLQLCNAFRYREQEEALMMLQSVLEQFFSLQKAPIHIFYAGDQEGRTAKFLAEQLEKASLLVPGEDYWGG